MGKLTAKQIAWLTKLRDEGPQRHEGRGRTRFSCRVAGWSEWMMRGPNGERRPASEVLREFPDPLHRHNAGWTYGTNDVETITEAGRAALSQEGGH